MRATISNETSPSPCSASFPGVTLYHADCRDILPTLACEAIVTDPPYAMVFGGRGAKWKARSFTKTLAAKQTALKSLADFDLSEYAEAIVGAKWKSAYFFCNKNLIADYISLAPKAKANADCLLWRKTCLPLHATNYTPDSEYIIFLYRKGRTWKANNQHAHYSKVIDANVEAMKYHPTQKPVAVVQRLIMNSTAEGQTVCDPFMGGGTTAIACIRTGRKFIGIERDAMHYKTACDRIAHELRQGVMTLNAKLSV